jgi:hypothetical protein
VIEFLSHHKAGIMALLRPADDGWSALDWLAFFDQRAHAAKVRGLAPAEGEALAFARCVVEWLNRNPARSSQGRCLGCGQAEQARDSLLPFGTARRGHAWLHSRCWLVWHTDRKADAIAALAAMGIDQPRTHR